MKSIFKKKRKEHITLNILDDVLKFIWALYTNLGLENLEKSSHKNYYNALKNSKIVNKDNKNRYIWDNLDEIGFVEQYEPNTFRVTYRGLNFLQGCLLRPVYMNDIPIGKVSEDKAR